MGVLRQELTQGISVEHVSNIVVLNLVLQNEMSEMYIFFSFQAHRRWSRSNEFNRIQHVTRKCQKSVLVAVRKFPRGQKSAKGKCKRLVR